MQKFLKKKEEGFTLVELMIVVVIIGVLASTAIPAFLRFIARSKSSEAGLQLKALFTGHATYYDDIHRPQGYSAGGGTATTRCLPGTFDFGLTPGTDEQAPPTLLATDPVLIGVNYELGDSIYYNYLSTGVAAACGQNDAGQLGILRANGNLDGDGIQSTFEIAFGIPVAGAPLAQNGVWKNEPLE